MTTVDEMLDALRVTGREITSTRLQLEALVDRRQHLVAALRGNGVPLVDCARAAGVKPEALALRDKRRGLRS